VFQTTQYGIVIAIDIQIQTIDSFAVKICRIIGGNESTEFRGVVSGIEIVEAGVLVVVVTSVANRVVFADTFS